MTDQATRTTTTGADTKATGTGWLLGAVSVTFVLAAVASFLPTARLWGLNHLLFFPVSARVAALAAVAVCFLPPVARAVVAVVAGAAGLLSRRGRASAVVVVVALAATATFIAFHSATNLLGDGQLIAQSFEAAHEGNKIVVMRSIPAIFGEEHIAPGATLFYYWAVHVWEALGGKTVMGMRISNALLGGVLVWLLLTVVRRVPASPTLRGWLLVTGLFTATLQLFFGYIENYTALVFFLVFYVVAGFLVLHHRAPWWVALAAFALACFSHIQGILFGPSLAFLVLWRVATKRRRGIVAHVPVTLIAVTIAGALVIRFSGVAQSYFLPLTAGKATYGLVSPAHLADLLNEAFLLMPLFPLAIALWLVARRAEKPRGTLRAGSGGRGAAGRGDEVTGTWFAHPAEWRFVWLMLVPCLLYMVLFKSEIGMARDWDLFSMTAVATVPLLILLVARYARATGVGPRAEARVAAPAWVLTMVLCVSWFSVNASGDRSAARYRHILDYDRTRAGYAYENLAIYYEQAHEMRKAVETMEIATSVSPNPRLAVRLALYLRDVGNLKDATDLMYKTLAKHPKYMKARHMLVLLLDSLNRWDDILPVARDGVRYHPREPVYYFYLGEALWRQGKHDEAAKVFQTCLKLNPPASALKHIEERMTQYEKEPHGAAPPPKK